MASQTVLIMRAKQPQHSKHSSRFSESKPTIRIGSRYQANIPTRVNEDEPSDLIRFDGTIPGVRCDLETINENPIESDSSSDSQMTEVDDLWSEVTDEEEFDLDWDVHLVPSSFQYYIWSATQHRTFLLSLYIFGKDFDMVKEFMGKESNIEMGSLLSFYYGMFYNSQEYKRWSKWTADRRKTLYARKILTGRQNDELLSRLYVTPELRDTLAMLGRNYVLGSISLSKFIFTLRDLVGINQLLEAIAIGQEERDLLELPSSGNSYFVIQELPTENKFSSVTNQEIIDILKGGARLSKEKTRHIFNDLVWPRLVSKGWRRCQNSENLVVFVRGVVDYFSPDENEKGIRYFDSMTDVLSMVASEPQLLESESDIEIPLDPDTNKHDLNMIELASSLVSEPTNETELGPEERLNLDMNHYLDNEERNGYINMLDDGIQEQTPSRNEKYVDVTEEQCLKLGAESDSGESSFPQELKTNTPDFSNAGASSMPQKRFSMRDRKATPKLLEAFAYGYLGLKRKRMDGEKMPSRQVHFKNDPVAIDCSGSAEKVDETSSQ